MTLAYVTVSIVFAIIVSFINIYCLLIIIRSRKLRSPPHMSIFSLLLGHALQGLVTIPFYAAKKRGIYKHTAVCDVFRFSYVLTNYWCCLSVLVISIDRFIGVFFPLRYRYWVTSKRMSRVFMCMWLYVLVLCLIPFIPSDLKECNYNPQREWVIMMLLGNTLLPFVIIVISYILIIRKINRTLINTMMEGASKEVTQSNAHKKEVKRAKMTFFIVGTYILCWGPSLVYYLLSSFCYDSCFHEGFHNSKKEEVFGFLIKFLTFVDGFVAPLVYCCASKAFNNLRSRVARSVRREVFRFLRRDLSVGRTNALRHGIVSTETEAELDQLKPIQI